MESSDDGTEDDQCVSYLLEERGGTKKRRAQVDTARWIVMTRALCIAEFCFSLVLGVCVIMFSLHGNVLLMFSSALYYFFGGVGALVVAWRFRADSTEEDADPLDLQPTRDQVATAVMAGAFFGGGVTITLCSVFYLQLKIRVAENDLVWLPLALSSGVFLIFAALQSRASVQLGSKCANLAAVYAGLMCVLSLGLMASHLILAYGVVERDSWIFFDPIVATVVAIFSIALGIKVALCDISGNHC